MADPLDNTGPQPGAPGLDNVVSGDVNRGSLNLGQGEPGFDRTGPLLSVDELKEDYLTGLPLQSALTGEPFSEDMFRRAITKAVGDVETSVRIPVSPTRKTDRFDYKPADDTFNFGTRKLSLCPVLKIELLEAIYPGRPDSQAIQFPTNWCQVGDGDMGLIRIVPISGSLLNVNKEFVLSPNPLIFGYSGGFGNFPNLWRITYIAGFNHDRIPAIVNDLIGTKAALRVISVAGPVMFPMNGFTVNVSGMSQAVSTMGPAFLAQRMQELQLMEQKLELQLKAHYGTDMAIGVVG